MKILTKKQSELVKQLRTRAYRYLLFGGGVGGGKSYLGATIIVNMAMTQENTSYAVIRKNLTTLKRTTLKTFEKYMRKNNFVEGRDYTFNRSDMTWTFGNGSIIYFMEADVTKDPELNKLGGLEITAAMIDEADEVVEAVFNVLKFRIGRNNDHGELAFLFLTCNPNQSWVRGTFYDKSRKNKLTEPYLFIEALATDNPYNNAEYIEAISDPNTPKQFRQRYFAGNWDYVSDDNAIIQLRDLERSYTDVPKLSDDRSIGCDPSREGVDNPVFCLWEGDQIAEWYVPDIEISDTSPITIEIARELIKYAKRHKVPASRVAVDAVGNGGGVVDGCRDEDFQVVEFKSGSTKDLELTKVDKTPKYNNIRSQSGWKMAKDLENGKATIYKNAPYREEFQKDILGHTFNTDGKRTNLDPKDDVKKLIGRSPDFFDSAMMGYWVKHNKAIGGIIKTGKSYNQILKKHRKKRYY